MTLFQATLLEQSKYSITIDKKYSR